MAIYDLPPTLDNSTRHSHIIGGVLVMMAYKPEVSAPYHCLKLFEQHSTKIVEQQDGSAVDLREPLKNDAG
jgi:hypothetical protein